MLVTLPGPGGSGQGGQVIIDVEVLPASATSATEANDLHPGEPSKIEDAPTSTSALPDAPDSAASCRSRDCSIRCGGRASQG